MDILETNSKKRDEDGDIKTFDIKASVDNYEVVDLVYISNALKHFHTGTLNGSGKGIESPAYIGPRMDR